VTRFLILICIIFPSTLFALSDLYDFQSQADKNRFLTLTQELRCLVCQNQNLADSNAPLANDLREEIYAKILQHDSNEEIIRYLVARYGNFILYRPPLNMFTLILWLFPLLVLLGSLGFFTYFVKRARKT